MGRRAGLWGRRRPKRHRESPTRTPILGSDTDDVVIDSRVANVMINAPTRLRMRMGTHYATIAPM